jgi:hypothetical protein
VLKFATAQIIAASLGDQQRLTRAAHRAVFQYEARPGFLYVRSRAISSRCNDNFDEFPAEEIAASYKTFVGKPVFVNHVNDNHRRARGVIIDAALHQDRNPDGTPDTWAEVLMEIDAVRFPKLAKAILAGHIDRTSMGCDVERSVCSACGNEARTPAEYCSHIPHLKGKRIFRTTAAGKKVGELVRETCFGLRFFENSVLVEPPADPTAHFLGVDPSGLGKTAAIDYSQYDDDGLEADDDGEDAAPAPSLSAPPVKQPTPHVPTDGTTSDRQRRQDAVTRAQPFTPLKPSLNALQATAVKKEAAHGLSVEAAGPQYENPGDHPWFKETGLSHEHILKHWDQATDEEKAQGARWYPDAHHVAKAIAKLNPDIKDDKEAAHKGAGVLSAYSPQQNWWANQHNAARSFVEKKAVGKGEGLMVMSSHANAAQRIMDGEDHQKVLKGPKTADFAHLIEHGGNDEHGQPSKKVVIDRHALSVAAGRRLNADDAKGFPSSNRHYYEHAAGHYRTAAAVISDREGRTVPPHEVQAVTWLTRQRLNADEDQNSAGGKGRQTVQRNQRQQWKDLSGEHTPELKEQGNSHVARVIDATFIDHDGSIRVEAFGEIKAPADVDTLREPNCPVCGDMDTFDGMQCQICGFISPPEQFRDPDLDKAKTMDLRKQIVDPSLVDNNGELQRVNDDGTGMPQADAAPGDEVPGDQEQDPNDPQMVDPDQLDENGLPPSPFGDQTLDGTQQGAPTVSDRNGDGMIQPDEIDPDGNVNAQQEMVGPEQGGQAGPRELPGRARDRTGDPFTPGPDMPRLTGPEGPEDGLDDEDAFQGSGMGAPQEPILAHPGDYTGDESESPHWSWNRDVSEEPQVSEDPEDLRRRRLGMAAPRTPKEGQPNDGMPDLTCPHCGFGADATAPQTQDMGKPAGTTDGIVAGDVCPNCRKAQLLTPGELQGESSVPPPTVPQLPRT